MCICNIGTRGLPVGAVPVLAILFSLAIVCHHIFVVLGVKFHSHNINIVFVVVLAGMSRSPLSITAGNTRCQLGVTYPNLKRKSGCQRLHRHMGTRGNVGAFAYVVKHSSLPKINAHMSYMYDPIDVMIRNKQDEWNIYYAWPEICRHNDHGLSTIVPQK